MAIASAPAAEKSRNFNGLEQERAISLHCTRGIWRLMRVQGVSGTSMDLAACGHWPRKRTSGPSFNRCDPEGDMAFRIPRPIGAQGPFSAISHRRRPAGNIRPTILNSCGYCARLPSLVPILSRSQVMIMLGTSGWRLRDGEQVIVYNGSLLGHTHFLVESPAFATKHLSPGYAGLPRQARRRDRRLR